MKFTRRDIASVDDHIELAWSRIPAGGGDFDLPDVISFADVRHYWQDYKAKLVQDIVRGSYYPGTVEIVDLPKGVLSVRPLARMSLPDRLVYEACVFAMAPAIDAVIPRAVYSYRWWKRGRTLVPSLKTWLDMQRRGRQLHKRHSSFLLAKTDVTSFYEYIDVDILMDDLDALDVPAWAVETLGRFLRAFNSLNQAWGLPQSSDASGILANLYLLPVDNEIIRNGLRHLRYSDDIWMFGSDWLDLRKVLLNINQILRTRRLSLASNKTKILPGSRVPDEFEDAEKDALNYGLQVAPAATLSKIRAMFDKAVGSDPVDVRDVRYSLTRLRREDDAYAVDWLLKNLGGLPHMARESLRYLDAFFDDFDTMGDALVDLLVNSNLAIYPYAEQHLLSFMIRRKVKSARANSEAWRILRDRNKESYVREFAARYLGREPAAGDGGRLRREFQKETNPRVRRALLVACYEARQRSSSWLDIIAASGSEVALTARYLKEGPKSVPVPWIEGSRAWRRI
ncbi:RNA-directed DNA polymerase [Actinoplanes sp. N902-109]|uniref:RNA-directed DNA polymerase n=1 Tax=Actinoplanes sp. (strain N902-109) TaxID=649831 RepID=UPI000A025C6E|nr:RNA-directed DNA polymerase [Actinoplanes sp. N902-109]